MQDYGQQPLQQNGVPQPPLQTLQHGTNSNSNAIISEAELDALVEQGLSSKENRTKRAIGRVVLFGLAALLLSNGVRGLASDGASVLAIEQLACAVFCIASGCLAKTYQRTRLKSKTRMQLEEIAKKRNGQDPFLPA